MNFSEYVAIVMGNTDLLDKAKIEKQIAGLESERQSFYRSKSSAKHKLEDYTAELDKAQSRFDRMSLDWNNLQGRIQKRSDGTVANLINWTAYRPMRSPNKSAQSSISLRTKPVKAEIMRKSEAYTVFSFWSKRKCRNKRAWIFG